MNALSAPAADLPRTKTSARETAVFWAVGVSACCAVFYLHWRVILGHFYLGAHFLDAGWFAHLFQIGDPRLPMPKVLKAGSFYQIHLSPYLYLIGAPLHRFAGLDGVRIFALHQGFFFALFLASLLLLADLAKTARAIAFIGAASIGGLSTLLLNAALFPHFEIALLALLAFAVASWLRGWRLTFAVTLAALLLVREDGGLYAAAACLTLVAISFRSANSATLALLGALAVGGLLAAIGEQTLQRHMFPDTSIFVSEIAGDDLGRLTLAVLGQRVLTVLSEPNLLVIVASTVLLARFDLRYAAGLVAIAPLLAVFLISPREVLWKFQLYYGLPWLSACVGWTAVFALRAAQARPSRGEVATFLISALVLMAPLQAAIDLDVGWPDFVADVSAPQTGLEAERDFALAQAAKARAANKGRVCASMGVVSLAADEFAPRELVYPRFDLSDCAAVLLTAGEVDYDRMAKHAADFGFRRTEAFANVEIWARQ